MQSKEFPQIRRGKSCLWVHLLFLPEAFVCVAFHEFQSIVHTLEFDEIFCLIPSLPLPKESHKIIMTLMILKTN